MKDLLQDQLLDRGIVDLRLQAVDGGASLRARRRTAHRATRRAASARQGHEEMTAAAARKAGPVPKQAFSTQKTHLEHKERLFK